jgi:hypothetical protein
MDAPDGYTFVQWTEVMKEACALLSILQVRDFNGAPQNRPAVVIDSMVAVMENFKMAVPHPRDAAMAMAMVQVGMYHLRGQYELTPIENPEPQTVH